VTRAPFAPTAACDAAACALLALTAAGRGPEAIAPWAWAALAGTAMLVYAAGMAANDLADREKDRRLAPNRPLPSGRLSPRAVGTAVAVLAAAAVALGGGPAGTRWAVGAALLLAMAYDFVRPLGVVAQAALMGGVRFANAATAVVPLVLSGDASPWTLLAPGAIGLYAAAITVLSTTEERESRARVRAARGLAAAGFGTMAAATGLAAGGAPHGVVLGWVFAGSVALASLAGRTPRPGPVKVQVREMLLGLYWLAAIAASAGDGGSLLVAGAAFVVAFLLIVAGQLAMRALARP
jgi:4-hydroxybenzoate polyprenyltransferase